jgi:hypothetical protein
MKIPKEGRTMKMNLVISGLFLVLVLVIIGWLVLFAPKGTSHSDFAPLSGTLDPWDPEVACWYKYSSSQGDNERLREAASECATLAISTYGPSPTPSTTPYVPLNGTEQFCSNYAFAEIANEFENLNDPQVRQLGTLEHQNCSLYGPQWTATLTPHVTLTPDDCLMQVHGGWPNPEELSEEELQEISQKYLQCSYPWLFASATPAP